MGPTDQNFPFWEIFFSNFYFLKLSQNHVKSADF